MKGYELKNREGIIIGYITDIDGFLRFEEGVSSTDLTGGEHTVVIDESILFQDVNLNTVAEIHPVHGIIRRSPDGTGWKITIDDLGVMSTESI